MKIFKVNNINEYSKVISSTLETGQLDGSPLFDKYNEFLTFFDVPDDYIELLYNDNGDVKWDNNAEILPKKFLEKYLNFRLQEQLQFTLPIYIVIDGEIEKHRRFNTFYEIQKLEEI